MAILPITLYGDKILQQKSIPVKEVTLDLITLVQDMFDTMYNSQGIGLSANQVGRKEALFVIDLSPVDEFKDHKPIVFLNPKIIKRSEETELGDEGCLSIPDVRAEVDRPAAITITYYDLELKEHSLNADGFFARVIQHEYDHLQGIYFTDRIDDDKKKAVKKDLITIKNRKREFEYPVTQLA